MRVAIVGAGPAGIYAADALTQGAGADVQVDIIDRLPTPFGLLRYGVAPDHVKMKSLEKALQRVLDRPQVRFFGHVELGLAVTAQDLLDRYDALLYAVGAAVDRRLDIPGEDLAGVLSAAQIVAWYNGHPDAEVQADVVAARSVAVIGFGNVAIDVTRILATNATALSQTDMPVGVLEALGRNRIETIHLLGRRGPAHARFSSKELRELGEIDGVDMLVDPRDLVLDTEQSRIVAEDQSVTRNIEILREWSERKPTGAKRQIELHFYARPTAFGGGRSLATLEMAHRSVTGVALPIDIAIRSVGYRGDPISGVPFDPASGTIPNSAGRVLRDGHAPGVTREYVSGWAKRGPRGVLGTNRSDSADVIKLLLEDAPRCSNAAPPSLQEFLHKHAVPFIELDGWAKIDTAERVFGQTLGRPRTKLASWDALREASGSQFLRDIAATSG